MLNKHLIVAAGSALLMIGFQNCSRAQFSSEEQPSLSKSSASSETLVAVEDPDESKQGQNPSSDAHAPQSSEEVASNDYVVCILVDHGKSLKLGLISDNGGGVHAVAQSICIPKATCLHEVPKYFAVEGAYDRGYCDHNPHVQRLTDAEVKALLSKNP